MVNIDDGCINNALVLTADNVKSLKRRNDEK